MSITDTAQSFFDACEAGKGWEVCKAWCHDGASFSCQADALLEITSLEGYVGWAASLLTPMPDIHPEIKSVGTDAKRNSVSIFATIHGTHTGEGGPVPATGKKASGDYVYVLQFDGDKISGMTKIWNDGFTLRQLGWA